MGSNCGLSYLRWALCAAINKTLLLMFIILHSTTNSTTTCQWVSSNSDPCACIVQLSADHALLTVCGTAQSLHGIVGVVCLQASKPLMQTVIHLNDHMIAYIFSIHRFLDAVYVLGCACSQAAITHVPLMQITVCIFIL